MTRKKHSLKVLSLAVCLALTMMFVTGCQPSEKQKETVSMSRLAEILAQAIPLSAKTELESEHPPLSDETKQAIADYKRNPCGETEQALLNALNKAYDIVIKTKYENLDIHTKEREERINSWLKAVVLGGTPPFMTLAVQDDKGGERQAVADAIAAYQQDGSATNKDTVRTALEAYYDAFLAEQVAHIAETEELKETRIVSAFEHFTSDRFQVGMSSGKTVNPEDVLAEIMASYISVGAVLLPVNPEARVNERQWNATIMEAQGAYLNEPTEENLSDLRDAIAGVFDTVYNVRLEGINAALSKSDLAAETLFNHMMDEAFLSEQYTALTEQLNLYGRIDRMITYGSNTHGEWTPRMQTESQELASLLHTYQESPTEENRQFVKTKFYEIYGKMLDVQKEHLEETQANLNALMEEILHELVN